MTEDLCEFLDGITLGKKISEFDDKDGNIVPIATSQLMIVLQVEDIPTEKKQIAEFDGKLKKDVEYETVSKPVVIPKSEVTGNDKDKDLLTTEIKKFYRTYVASSMFKMKTVFSDKEEAAKKVHEWNRKVLEIMEG